MRPATYVVASTPRSGSTLLCEGLEATGIAGRPAEVFAPAFEAMWREFWALPEDAPFGEFVQTALAYGTTANGIYGAKIHWEHVPELAGRLAVTGNPAVVLDALFPGAVFVSIVRRDRRAQALSLFRAMATNEWCKFAGVPAVKADGLVLDRDTVRILEAAIEAQQAGWTNYFHTNGIMPLTVEYELLDADYRGQVGRVLEFLGCDPAAALDIPDPRLVRQSDELNLRWYREMDADEVGGRA